MLGKFYHRQFEQSADLEPCMVPKQFTRQHLVLVAQGTTTWRNVEPTTALRDILFFLHPDAYAR